jgi:hypothetical protein
MCLKITSDGGKKKYIQIFCKHFRKLQLAGLRSGDDEMAKTEQEVRM